MDAVHDDAATLKTAIAKQPDRRAFMSAASPCATALFFANDYYPNDEAYLFALADGLAHEYQAIAEAIIILQVDCPDLAMGRHTQFRELSLSQFLDRMAVNIAALNHATRNIAPKKMRMHLCWGNDPGPHHRDVPMRNIIGIIWTANPNAIQFEAANPRRAHEFELFQEIGLLEGKLIFPASSNASRALSNAPSPSLSASPATPTM